LVGARARALLASAQGPPLTPRNPRRLRHPPCRYQTRRPMHGQCRAQGAKRPAVAAAPLSSVPPARRSPALDYFPASMLTSACPPRPLPPEVRPERIVDRTPLLGKTTLTNVYPW